MSSKRESIISQTNDEADSSADSSSFKISRVAKLLGYVLSCSIIPGLVTMIPTIILQEYRHQEKEKQLMKKRDEQSEEMLNEIIRKIENGEEVDEATRRLFGIKVLREPHQ